jgi:hypothetical protein
MLAKIVIGGLALLAATPAPAVNGLLVGTVLVLNRKLQLPPAHDWDSSIYVRPNTMSFGYSSPSHIIVRLYGVATLKGVVRSNTIPLGYIPFSLLCLPLWRRHTEDANGLNALAGVACVFECAFTQLFIGLQEVGFEFDDDLAFGTSSVSSISWAAASSATCAQQQDDDDTPNTNPFCTPACRLSLFNEFNDYFSCMGGCQGFFNGAFDLTQLQEQNGDSLEAFNGCGGITSTTGFSFAARWSWCVSALHCWFGGGWWRRRGGVWGGGVGGGVRNPSCPSPISSTPHHTNPTCHTCRHVPVHTGYHSKQQTPTVLLYTPARMPSHHHPPLRTYAVAPQNTTTPSSFLFFTPCTHATTTMHTGHSPLEIRISRPWTTQSTPSTARGTTG